MLSQSTRSRLATQLECLQVILGGRDAVAINRRPASGKWSTHENLAHLARMHEITLERIRRILSEGRPELPRYKAEDDPEWPPWTAMRTEEVLRRLSTLRDDLVQLVTRLSPEQLNRVGVHGVLGGMTIPEWIEFFLLHEAHHLYAAMQRARGG
ncbi:MAG: DinB family protein [Candidatus Methylomirabilales bacterium]